MDNANLEYLSSLQCARQWRGFIQAFAVELGAQHSEADLAVLMRRAGSRFAQGSVLGSCDTLWDLQLAMGRVWIGLDWGWVVLEETADHLRVRHHCSPLLAAFGAGAERWSPAFLEGVYQEWFRQAGAGDLHVRQAGGFDAAGGIEFHLAAASHATS
ncbi:cellulose biosynthesis protein BcsD [Xylophilus sp. GW821-FHT01B05]